MDKKNAAVFLALFLNMLFSVLFIGFLLLMKENQEQVTLHMNQIGIYASQENANQSIEKVQALGLQASSYALQDLYVVVASIYEDAQKTQDEQLLLEMNEISFIYKEVASSNPVFIAAIQSNDIQKIMEMMENQSS